MVTVSSWRLLPAAAGPACWTGSSIFFLVSLLLCIIGITRKGESKRGSLWASRALLYGEAFVK